MSLLRLSFANDWIHNKTTQASTINNCFKFFFCVRHRHLGQSTLFEFEGLTNNSTLTIRGIRRDKFHFILLYLCDSFLETFVSLDKI